DPTEVALLASSNYCLQSYASGPERAANLQWVFHSLLHAGSDAYPERAQNFDGHTSWLQPRLVESDSLPETGGLVLPAGSVRQSPPPSCIYRAARPTTAEICTDLSSASSHGIERPFGLNSALIEMYTPVARFST